MTLPAPLPAFERPQSGPLVDRYGRAHTYLRVSVTDRCNYRCTYCMPAEGLKWLPRTELMTYEELTRVVGAFVRLGVRRVRLTGGEPTVRQDLVTLVAHLAAIPGLDDLSMTSNGERLAGLAGPLARAGLRRVNISLDTLDPEQFRALTRTGDLRAVLAAIDAALKAGLTPVKINAVMARSVNEGQVVALARHFGPLADRVQVRFIETMPFRDAARVHLPAAEMRAMLAEHYTLEPLEAPQGGGPARYWRLRESGLAVGFISPITEHFCQACNRLRLMVDGHVRTCLSRDDTPSLRDLVRAGADDAAIEAALREMVWAKVAGHEAHLDGDAFRAFEGVMTAIGG